MLSCQFCCRVEVLHFHSVIVFVIYAPVYTQLSRLCEASVSNLLSRLIKEEVHTVSRHSLHSVNIRNPIFSFVLRNYGSSHQKLTVCVFPVQVDNSMSEKWVKLPEKDMQPQLTVHVNSASWYFAVDVRWPLIAVSCWKPLLEPHVPRLFAAQCCLNFISDCGGVMYQINKSCD